MVNQRPTTEEVRREGRCNLHFLGEEGGLPGVEITGLGGKQQIIGKIRGKIRGEWGKIQGEILGKLRGVIIVNTQEGVIEGLVPP